MNGMFILFLIGLMLHVIAVFSDIQTMEVPFMISISYFLISASYMGLYNRDKIMECLITAIIISVILSVFVYKANLGGADLMFLSGSSLFFGYWSLYSVVIAFGLSLPYAAYMKVRKNEHDYPFMPYIMVSYIITFFLYFSHL